MMFRGYEITIKPREKNPSDGLIYSSTCTRHFWALKDIQNDEIILKSKMYDTKEEAEKASSEFYKRLIVDLSD